VNIGCEKKEELKADRNDTMKRRKLLIKDKKIVTGKMKLRRWEYSRNMNACQVTRKGAYMDTGG
jgi:hypothetical protein